MKRGPSTIVVILGLLALVLLLAWNIVLTSSVREAVAELRDVRLMCDKVKTLRLPVDFLMNEPQCANTLLASIGVDSVRLTHTQQNSPAEAG